MAGNYDIYYPVLKSAAGAFAADTFYASEGAVAALDAAGFAALADGDTVYTKDTISNGTINYGAHDFTAAVKRGVTAYGIDATAGASDCNVFADNGETDDATTWVKVDPYANAANIYINTIAPARSNIATTAATVSFQYKLGLDTKTLQTSVSFTNDFKAPTVKAVSKTYTNSPTEAYSTNVDLNNNTSSHESVVGVYSDANRTAFVAGAVATHVEVETNINSANNNITFFISSNAGKLTK